MSEPYWVPLAGVNQLAPAGYGTSLPASPIDGQRFVLTDSLTAPTYSWGLRYSTLIADAYKWVFTGGSPLHAAGGSMTTAATSPVALTSGPAVLLPRAGIYSVLFGCTALSNGNAGARHAYTAFNYENGSQIITYTTGLDGTWEGSSDLQAVRYTAPASGTLRILVWESAGSGTSSAFQSAWFQVVPVRLA